MSSGPPCLPARCSAVLVSLLPGPCPSQPRLSLAPPSLASKKNEGVVPSIWRRGGRLLVSKRDTSLFSYPGIMFHLADFPLHLNSIPQANNTIKQMERRFSNNKFHRNGHSFACRFKGSRALRRINHPESHGLKYYIETASKS